MIPNYHSMLKRKKHRSHLHHFCMNWNILHYIF